MFKAYVSPLLMTALGVPVMGFGVVGVAGSLDGFLKTGSALVGFLTAIGGLIITILGIMWWARRLRYQGQEKEKDNYGSKNNRVD